MQEAARSLRSICDYSAECLFSIADWLDHYSLVGRRLRFSILTNRARKHLFEVDPRQRLDYRWKLGDDSRDVARDLRSARRPAITVADDDDLIGLGKGL